MFRHKTRKPPNRNSVFLAQEQWQYSGNAYRRLSQLPEHIIEEISGGSGIPEIVTELDQFSVQLEIEEEVNLENLKALLGNLMNFEPRRSQDDASSDEEQNKYAAQFHEHVGYSETELLLRIKSLVLEILTKITTTNVGEKVTKQLMENDDVLNYVFTLLAHQKTFINSCQLIEDLLQSSREVLDLHRIQNVRGLISCLNDPQLANFCLFAQNKQKRSKGFINIRDINQDTPRYRGMVSELDCWMEWIENQMAEEMYDLPTMDDLDDFIGGISEPTSAGGPMNVQQGLKITEELVQRVEVVYVLGLFLLGKHRKKVQRKLAELKLAPGLSELFDQFIWKCQVYSSRHRLRGHNAACECSPEVALKIQFLRLVHSFCDHSDYKHLLLSKNELNEIFFNSLPITAKAGTLALSNLENVNKTLMCKGSKGLLTKIVEVMKKEPTTSTFRFWLARAVESYLRGNTSYCDQVFLMRRGLLQHVATNIVEHEIRHKEILQSSFDLLGELIKFNIEAFKSFEEILSTQPKFDKFVNTVNRNLVDSNMFIRSLVLSLEHFYNTEAENISNSTEKQEKLPEKQFRNDYAKKDNKLLMYIGDFNRQLDYLYKLIKIINVQNLTQSQLPRYLRALRDEKEDMLDVSGSAGILRNFSSKISFDYWKQTVSLLVSDDKEEQSGILHYIQQIPCDRPN
ncbi:hypothetical protein KUTeg_019368 [Tegillarca granosa]|uniref:Uncharacterized protein n=1 Tax=Tegillarca granosa TaxID=220873 RepID=A0ABQ9EGC2_TEGGR|nr:hypothetical protein KUTeg_019368 [Tegillarca granosa]